MKKRTQLILTIAAAGAMASTAHATYLSGDLLVGFTSTGAASDYIFDVGAYSSLTSGETWTLGADLGGTLTSSQFSNGVWGVVGALSTTKTIYSSAGALGVPVENPNAFNTIRGNVQSIGASSVAGAAVTPGQTTANSWYSQTAQPNGTVGNYFFNNLDNPNVGTGSPAALYANDNLGDTATLLGDFTISGDGNTLTFTAVPEPGTLSILAGFGLLALKFRRQLARNA
jgi:hypothetical protein